MDEARQVRDFWFGKLPMTAQLLNQRAKFWFCADMPEEAREKRSQMIRTRFADLIERAAKGELAGWADSPRRCLSLIILLDQFPRDIYSGTAKAFASDELALAATLSGIRSAADAALDVVERLFFYMPLQHCEALEIQDESVAAYRRLALEAPQELREIFDRTVESAQEHRGIIERFGRFPDRNRALGRPDTPQEEAWLSEGARAGS